MNGLNQNAVLNQADTGLISCLWMQAGVVDYKLCDRAYDCEHCPFDEAFHTHSAKTFIRASQTATTQTVSIQGCEVAQSTFYHRGHTWARIEAGGVVRVGLDDFGQRMLGRAYAVALPAANSNVKRGSACWHFTHQSGVTVVSAPVSGRVKKVNSSLSQRPALINRDPYGEGWTVLIEPVDLKACLKHLMYGDQIPRWLGAEIEKLRFVIDQTVSDDDSIHMTMTDGGILTREFIRGLTVAQRRQVVCSFFPLSLNDEADRIDVIKIKDGR